MFESLTEKLSGIFDKVRSRGIITEENIEGSLRDIRLSLLEADVHYKVAGELIQKIKEKALGEKVLKSLTPGQVFTKIVQDELAVIMGEEAQELSFKATPPAVILMVGLQGSGKTITCIKLACFIQKNFKKKVYLVPADMSRPAAIDQLKTLAKQNDLSCYDTRLKDKPLKVVKRALGEASKRGDDAVLIDTAGRLHIDEVLMNELLDVKKKTNPVEILLVVDSMMGNDAVPMSTQFHEKLGLTGVILTKLDGDARGGAALSIMHVTGIPIKFVGLGEKSQDFEVFDPQRMASRILDKGDVVGLVEKAQAVFEEEEIEDLSTNLFKNDFTLVDFLKQLRMLKKMGPLQGILKMIPQMGTISKSLLQKPQENHMKRVEAIILSMTPGERKNYKILNGSRRLRIAEGSGTSIMEVNRLLKQFINARKMMKNMKKFGKLPI
ncbi:MAG: signal recognition particle protein [Deltaproteobacteria bacterium]|nr:signal recognition particle protein [Deltaproteobacteria bacterium]